MKVRLDITSTRKLDATSSDDIKSQDLDRNLKRYTITTSTPNKYNIEYIPLTVGFELDNDYNHLYLNSLKEILKYLVELYVFTDVDLVTYYVESANGKKIVIYSPSYKGFAVQVHKNNISTISDKINLKVYYGYQLISKDRLEWYAISQYHKKYENINYSDILSTKSGLYLKVKVPDQFINDDIVLTLRSMVKKYSIDGFFIPKRSISDSMIHAYIELAYVWNGKVIQSSNPMIIKSKIDYIYGSKEWYNRNSIKILNKKLPEYTIMIDYKYKSQIEQSYEQLKSYHSILKEYNYNINKLGDKIQFKASFINYEQVQDFKLIINGTRPSNGVHNGCAKSSSCVNKNIYNKRLSGGPKGEFVYKKIVKGIYDIYLKIKTKYLVPYTEYTSFLIFSSLYTNPEHDYIFYKNKKTTDIEGYIDILNEKWKSYQLITDWG